MAPKKRPSLRSKKIGKADSLKFLKRREGQWAINLESAARKGDYSFDPSTGQLSTSRGAAVGRLRLQALGPLPSVGGMPHITVCSGEIMEEIQKKENAGAFFVLPSQMNAAEYPDCKDTAIVTDVDDYRYDHTAGPRGQLAGHLACAQFLLDNAKSSLRKKGLDALGKLLPFSLPAEPTEVDHFLAGLEVQNGYLTVPSQEFHRPAEEVRSEVARRLEARLPKLRSVAMLQVPAAGLTPGLDGFSKSRHSVNLVYASAVPVNAYNNATDSFEDVLLQRCLASTLLKGVYLGALKLALEESRTSRRQKVFLLPLGGGVFNNPFKDIAQAMADALRMASSLCHRLSDVLDVQVLTWKGKPQEAERFRHLLSELGA